MPDDHHRAICCAGYDPARLRRARTARPRRFLAVPRADPRGVLAGRVGVHPRCRAHSLALFSVRRADVECFAAEWETRGGPCHAHRRLCTIAGFYEYAVEEELRTVALDRNEFGALLMAAGLGPPTGHALISSGQPGPGSPGLGAGGAGMADIDAGRAQRATARVDGLPRSPVTRLILTAPGA